MNLWILNYDYLKFKFKFWSNCTKKIDKNKPEKCISRTSEMIPRRKANLLRCIEKWISIKTFK